MMFYMQVKSKSGEWVDFLGSNDEQWCIDHALFLIEKRGEICRVVERVDKTVWVGHGPD